MSKPQRTKKQNEQTRNGSTDKTEQKFVQNKNEQINKLHE